MRAGQVPADFSGCPGTLPASRDAVEYGHECEIHRNPKDFEAGQSRDKAGQVPQDSTGHCRDNPISIGCPAVPVPEDLRVVNSFTPNGVHPSTSATVDTVSPKFTGERRRGRPRKFAEETTPIGTRLTAREFDELLAISAARRDEYLADTLRAAISDFVLKNRQRRERGAD